MSESKEEYFALSERLDIVRQAINGSCDDIDCDKYTYLDILKIKYKPVLEHNFSCIDKLKNEEKALLRILGSKKYKKFRYEYCEVCKEPADKLDKKTEFFCFTKKLIEGKCSQVNGFSVHKKCYKKAKVPEGWNKF